MLRFLMLLVVAVAVGVVLAPHLVELLSWALAFLILLMLGDLLFSRAPSIGARGRATSPES